MDSHERTVTAARLADGAAFLASAIPGATTTEPVLVVDLDDVDEELAVRAAAGVAALDRLVIGRATRPVPPRLARLTAALDVTYAPLTGPTAPLTGPTAPDRTVVGVPDVDAALDAFLGAAARNPQAALIAAQVLRISETLPVPRAVEVESLAYSALQGGAEFGRWLAERRALGRSLPPPPATDPVLVRREGGVLRITLNRPERRNAYGTAVRDALVEALRVALFDDSVREVVLAGAGPCFCAGGDLDEFGHTPDHATAHFLRTAAGAARSMALLAARTRVELHGQCVGAGIEVPAFAGRIVAAPDSVFRLPEVGMGLIPGAGGTVSIPRRIGRWRALHLFVTGAALDAARALDWGLVDEITGARGSARAG
ncbi:MAG TPA: enoyl-CoA hydratase/isomerase family protein [Nocardia sp.]|uniref:enoyl-CoA hydratase/isomerase family protein n=1 Tax=Nocardia sp. TaxID=1821 RepID=UPI002B4AEBAD|nr:enoyl-CoA hydratase/isomerase family protein [Nocardia sp.]HLS76492.1 enoyl-CoA hydratase/isomerase family protein [Nocardia sp.]